MIKFAGENHAAEHPNIPPRNERSMMTKCCRSLLLLTLALASVGAPVRAQTLDLKHESVLIVNQIAKEYAGGSVATGELVERFMLHFTPNTRVLEASDYEAGTAARYTKVVFIGNDASTPPSEMLIRDLKDSNVQILWLGMGLRSFLDEPENKYGFFQTYFHSVSPEDTVLTITYQGKKYASNLEGYNLIRLTKRGPRLWSNIHNSRDPVPVPLVISSGNLWFVNFLPELADHPTAVDDVPTLIFADVLHDFFQTGIKKQQKAIIRLEDVSTHVAPAKLEQISQYLASEKVPFAIGLIPNQRLATGRVDPLGEHLGLVRTLRSAQANGGTIVLHGYFHTFGTGEDYEFWDDVRKQPLTGETHLLYACKASDGIRILRDLGLEPKMWETPHYSGSNLTYEVMGKYFSHALENRRGATWMPYGYGPDKFGQVVIPENIGYISPDPRNKEWTVQRQLERAELLQIVRDAWVLGFYHPVVVPISALKELVAGLRALGYEFVDLSKLPTEVYYDYKQSKSAERATWLSTSFGINVRKFERWWNSVRENVTYPLVLLGGLSTTGAAQANVSPDAIKVPVHGKADPRCRYFLE